MRTWIMATLLALAGAGAAGCGSTGVKSSLRVFASDPCQPVREQNLGGVIVYCKGQCPGKPSSCGRLQSRAAHTGGPWRDDDGSTYDVTRAYRCRC
jgi:hypothetical protein